MKIITILLMTVMLASCAGPKQNTPAWQKLPEVQPQGQQDSNIKCYMSDNKDGHWEKPKFVYNHDVAIRPVVSKVIVVVFDPILTNENNQTTIEYLKANDPVKFSQIMADSIKECSDGYINYDIVDVITLNEFPRKIDGFCYSDESFVKAVKEQKFHQPDRSNYRTIFERNNLIERCQKEGVNEIWMWGAGGFGFDELAMYIPNRYARFAPTLNPWFYRPYEIPAEIGHTVWVMGFNYQVGTDNMLHSYSHRCESILALVFGYGEWKKELAGCDPWNTYSMLNLDFPDKPSQCGNVHVPPNGQFGYDYVNTTNIMSCANAWYSYPDISKEKPRLSQKEEWGNDQFGFQKWWLRHFPKKPGYTKWGYNNWWVYIANTDEDLPYWYPSGPEEFKVNPAQMP